MCACVVCVCEKGSSCSVAHLEGDLEDGAPPFYGLGFGLRFGFGFEFDLLLAHVEDHFFKEEVVIW